ncbi:MAG: CPBP family intramembrane metalloprotease [Akkermansiaceae bacterium]
MTDPDTLTIFQDVLSAVVVAPIFEELLFRGVLFMGLMKRIRPVPAALVSSTLFALMHTQYDPWGLLSVGVMGLVCCWLVWRTGSIKWGVALHAIYNLVITVDVYLLYQMAN